MLTVRQAPPEHYQWMVDRIGIYPSQGFRALEALSESGDIMGMVGYDGWTPSSCFMHVAIDSPLVVRRLLVPSFDYVFKHAGKKVALGLIREKNIKALNNAKVLGFSELSRIKDGWDAGEDMVLFEMRRENCKWIRGKENL